MPAKGRDLLLGRFLATYLLVLVLPIAVFSVTYARTLAVYEKDADASNRSVLRQTSALVEKTLMALDELVQDIAMDPRLARLLHSSSAAQSPSYAVVVDAWESLVAKPSPSDFVVTTFVHVNALDLVLTRSTVYQRSERFYAHNFLPESAAPGPPEGYAEWREQFLDAYQNRRAVSGARYEIRGAFRPAVIYLQSLPLLATSRNRSGVVGVVLDRQILDRAIDDLQVYDEYGFTLTDHTGKLIISLNRPETLGVSPPSGVLSTSHVSSLTGWRYDLVVPRSVVFRRIAALRGIAVGYAVAVFAVGLALSVLLSRGISRPLRDVTDIVGASGGRRPLDALAAGARALFRDNERLRQEAARREGLLAEALVFRLLKGEVEDDPRTRPAGLPGSGACYSVIAVGPAGLDPLMPAAGVAEMRRFVETTRDAVRRSIGAEGICVETEPGRLAALVWAPAGSEARLDALADRVAIECASGGEQPQALGIGNTVGDVVDVHRSYREALECLEFAAHARVAVIRPADIPRAADDYWYPLEVETRLVALSRAGRLREALAAFDEVVHENFDSRRLGPAAAGQLLDELGATIVKTRQRLRSMDLVAGADPVSLRGSRQDPSDLRREVARIRDELAGMCEIVERARRSHNTTQAGRLLGLVRESYRDPDLSLDSLGRELHLSPSYLSRFFREQTGHNFSVYLEGLRIEAAVRLLQETRLNVAEVGARVGYRSDQSFRRAYKRRTGVSPRTTKSAVV